MAQQDDVNDAIAKAKAVTASANAATQALTSATAKLTGLNIPVPVDTSGLGSALDESTVAVKAMTDAGVALSQAVDAEAAKINPPAA